MCVCQSVLDPSECILLLFFAFFLRCSMNAFLSVRISSLPVRNFQDLLDKKYALALWKEDSLEEFLKVSPIDTLPSRVYREAKREDRLHYLKNTDQGIELALGDAVGLLEYHETMVEKKEKFPCLIDEVKGVNLLTIQLSFPFKKGATGTFAPLPFILQSLN